MSERLFETFYEDEDFCVDLELYQEILYLHCEVYNYSKSVRKRMKEVFQALKEVAYFEGWDAIHSYTPNPKFAKLWEGGFKIAEFEHLGTKYEVVRWELKQQ